MSSSSATPQTNSASVPEQSWLRQMSNRAGHDPKVKHSPEVVLSAFCDRLVAWHRRELQKRGVL
jgi:hypothetical protein